MLSPLQLQFSLLSLSPMFFRPADERVPSSIDASLPPIDAAPLCSSVPRNLMLFSFSKTVLKRSLPDSTVRDLLFSSTLPRWVEFTNFPPDGVLSLLPWEPQMLLLPSTSTRSRPQSPRSPDPLRWERPLFPHHSCQVSVSDARF